MKKLRNERWKEVREVKGKLMKRYAISDFGRLVSFDKKIEDGTVLRCSRLGKFKIWRIKLKGNSKGILIHKLVAQYFLPKPGKKNMLVIHLDHKLDNNHYRNLKYVTMYEQRVHGSKSPASRAANRKLILEKRKNPNPVGQKLKLPQVKILKRMIFDKKRKQTFSQIAKKFRVSEMQIYRIKRGELWNWVKV